MRKSGSDIFMVIVSFFVLGVLVTSLMGVISAKQADMAGNPIAPTGRSAVTVDLLTMREDGEGSMAKATVELQAGKGRVLVKNGPLNEIDFQDSLNIARDLAAGLTGEDLSDIDVIYSVDSSADVLRGSSGGAAITVATMAAIEGKAIDDDVIITGVVDRDGAIGPVGGILKKGETAARAGKKYLFVPKGERYLKAFRKVPQTRLDPHGEEMEVEVLVPTYIDLEEYLQEINPEIHVLEIDRIDQAVSAMIV